MRRSFPLAVALAVVLVLGLTGSVPAVAKAPSDTASVTDKAGDAPAGIDLLSGKYFISGKKAKFKVKLKKLTDTTFLAFEVWPLNSAWDRVAVYRENGKTVGKVYFVDNEEEPTPYLRKCPGLKVKWKPGKAQVRVVLPRACMQASTPGSNPYEFHVFSRFGGVAGSARDAMPVKTLDY